MLSFIKENRIRKKEEGRREHSVIVKCYKLETENVFHTDENTGLVAQVFH